MQVAEIWGGRLMVIAPLYSMHTQSPTEKQCAFGVWTSTSWEVQRSQTNRSQQLTQQTRAFMVSDLLDSSMVFTSKETGDTLSYAGGRAQVRAGRAAPRKIKARRAAAEKRALSETAPKDPEIIFTGILKWESAGIIILACG